MKLTTKQLADVRASADGANRVGRAIKIAATTQRAVASATGIGVTHLNKIVRGGYKDVPLEVARTLAATFGCAIEDLFPPRSTT